MKYLESILIVIFLIINLVACSLSTNANSDSSNPSSSDTALVTVSSVNPSSGCTLGGDTLTISGTGFASDVSVKLGGSNCSNISSVTSTQIKCVSVGGSAGDVNIVVTSGSQSATLINGYTYIIPSAPVPTIFDIYFASQTTNTSLILKLRYSSLSNAISLTATNDVTSTLGTDGIRYFVDSATGGFLIGGANSAGSIWNGLLSPFSLGIALSMAGRPVAELSDYIGGCTLPNGNIVAGSYGNGLKAEYSSARMYLRDLPAMTFYLSDCVATSNSNTLYAADYDANSDSAGLIQKFTFNGSTWTQAASLNVTTFSGATSGSVYSLVLNTNGHLYIPPQAPGVGSVSKLIRCQNGDLSNCAGIGSNWPVSYPNGAVEGALQIPGTNDMLFIDNSSIYRYKVSDDTMTVIYTLAVPGVQWIRGMRIRTVP